MDVDSNNDILLKQKQNLISEITNIMKKQSNKIQPIDFSFECMILNKNILFRH